MYLFKLPVFACLVIFDNVLGKFFFKVSDASVWFLYYYFKMNHDLISAKLNFVQFSTPLVHFRVLI